MSIVLPVDAPYSLEATVRLLQRRPANPIDRWEDDRYLRALQVGRDMALVEVGNRGSVDYPDLRLEVMSGELAGNGLDDVVAAVRWMLGLDAPPVPAEGLIEIDPRLAPTMERLRGFRPPCFPDLFATCLGVLPFQQLSLDAGIAILGRLAERFGPCLEHDGREWLDLPAPESVLAATLDDLVAAGLSRAKAVALRGLAEAALAGELDRDRYDRLPTPEAMCELQRLPGIGPWSAGLIMLRGLRRMDVFPAGDSGAARSLTGLLRHPAKLTPTEADRIAATFGDIRGYLYYLCLGSRQSA
jgi:DNA-3-methyladenine glycosylase II